MLYNWVKAAHIISVIALMAGLLIYPRYKIHQLSSQPGEPLFETMKEASNKLRKIILNPALVLAWLFGLTMLAMNHALIGLHWMQVKLVLVVAISALHGWFISVGKKIDAGATPIQQKRLRLWNEVPFLLMIGIVIMAVAEPF